MFDTNTRLRSRAPHGVVMVIALLGALLLGALVMFVLNIGVQTNRRVVAQHAADASAAAGSAWVARSLNTVAMNNVATTRLISFVNILDAMPMATRFSFEDQTALMEGIENAQAAAQDPWVQDALSQMHDEVTEELRVLGEMNAFFLQHPVHQMTHYNAPGGHGHLWEAMHAMDEFSQATMENVGQLAQLNAIRGGEVNLTDRTAASAALMLPVSPDLPWQRGSFDDFERPVRFGLLPVGTDDEETNRGPYDVLYGWRRLHGRQIDGYWVGESRPRPTVAAGGRGNVPIGAGANSGGGRPSNRRFIRTGETEPTHYSVYGPYSWMKRFIGDWHEHNLHHARFSRHHHTISDIKMSYLWPAPGGPIRQVIDPDWVTDFDEATAIADGDVANPAGETRKIKETAFIAVEIKSLYPRSDGRFMTPGTWAYISSWHHDHEHRARLRLLRNWVDPRTWNAPKIADHIWSDEWSYQVYDDPDLGIENTQDAEGNPIPVDVYRIDEFMFVGVNVGEEIDVPSPYNFDSRDDLPAPIDLDRNVVEYTDDSRREHMTYLAVARRRDNAIAWPSRFRGGKPYPNNVAIAQAHVFNNHSWDLWTQQWYSQLQPIDDFSRWVDKMEDDTADVGLVQSVDPNEYDDLLEYFKSVEGLAEVMLSH